MAVGDYSTDFHIVPGVRLGGVPCGIKGIDQLDLVLFEIRVWQCHCRHFHAKPFCSGARAGWPGAS